MQLEIQVALNFLISYLYNKLPRRRVNTFGEELQRQLEAKFKGHWYPDRPSKGSGYRCLQVGVKVDPVVEQAARQSGLDLADVRHNLPQDLSVWIDPYEVSYQIGDKGPVKVLYVDDSGPEGGGGGAAGADLDKEIRNSFNPEAQVFLPISEPPGGGGVVGVGGGGSPASSSPSPPFGHSEAGSPSFLPRSAQPLTFTTATFAATKFGSTKMKSSGRGNNNNPSGNHSNNNMGNNNNNNSSGNAGKQTARSSPSGLKHPSMLSLYGPPHLKPSALSPNAKEFVFPSLQCPGSPGGALFPGEESLGLGPLGYGHALDMLAAYGGLGDAALMDGLGLGALQYSHQQYSHQQYQPVMAN
ncbi:protein Tob1 [Gadus morhua]|uniref:Protein Tob1-like n=1 Tax=Gadus morhua TaxID=8049 RepID=A0A8C4ZUX6_GADMO|nr:protein Tob1-like [Gadus morhua]